MPNEQCAMSNVQCQFAMPPVTICALTYGDYPQLARRLLESIRRHCLRSEYHLIVGANAIGVDTLAYLQALQASGEIDQLILSPVNLNKCRMMRRMFDKVETEFIWWFDDDSYLVEPGALANWLEFAQAHPPSTVMWGQSACCDAPETFTDLKDVLGFVRSAPWYGGLPPPSWRPGGGGEFNFENRGCGDGRWFFILGGCWLIRTRTVRALDWPDRRLIKLGDDVFLGEAIRQNGWHFANIGPLGVAMDTEPRRGTSGGAGVSIGVRESG
jgi:GT2 family glycosyltransferase